MHDGREYGIFADGTCISLVKAKERNKPLLPALMSPKRQLYWVEMVPQSTKTATFSTPSAIFLRPSWALVSRPKWI